MSFTIMPMLPRILQILSMTVLLASPAYAELTIAPSFTLTDADGQKITLPSKLDGVDIYLFWASWCPYCKALMPHLQSIQIEYGDDVRVYALNIRDDEDPVEFMQNYGYDFVILPEADPVMGLYGVRPTPALFLVDRQGVVQFNLYQTMLDDSNDWESLSNRQKAARRAPGWAAEIRRTIDNMLGET